MSVLNGRRQSGLGQALRRCCWETLQGSGRWGEPVCLWQRYESVTARRCRGLCGGGDPKGGGRVCAHM